MEHVVAKSINTTIHRLKAGAPVDESMDLTPFTFAELKARGFIAAKVEPVAAVPASPRRGGSVSQERSE